MHSTLHKVPEKNSLRGEDEKNKHFYWHISCGGRHLRLASLFELYALPAEGASDSRKRSGSGAKGGAYFEAEAEKTDTGFEKKEGGQETKENRGKKTAPSGEKAC